MIPFPGESLALDLAWSDGAAGFNLGREIVYRGTGSLGTTGHATLDSEWRVWVFPGSGDYLEESDLDLSVSWVLEVDSGTVTVSASEGYDPYFGYAAASTTRSLGSHSITGPGTLVIPSGYSCADVNGDTKSTLGELFGAFTVTAGSAQVSQVKLRAWPASGAVGGWSADVKPSYTTTPAEANVRYSLTLSEGQSTSSDPETAWDDAGAAFYADLSGDQASQERTFSTSLASSPAASQGMRGLGLGNYEATWSLISCHVMVTGSDAAAASPIDTGTYVEETDWIRPPEEVQGDADYYTQQVGSDAYTVWSDATIDLTISDPDSMPGDVTLYSVGGDWTDLTAGSGVSYSLALNVGAAVSSGTHALASTTERQILIHLSHTIAEGASDTWPGWTPGATVINWTEATAFFVGPDSSTKPTTYAVVPSYRVWDPNASAEYPLRLIQRGDSLGMGSGRVLGVGTRQNSSRVFGSI